jgi:hypothetical protein
MPMDFCQTNLERDIGRYTKTQQRNITISVKKMQAKTKVIEDGSIQWGAF